MPDIPYDRPEGRRKYTSIAKHQSMAQNQHAKWLSINIERDLFDFADYGNYGKNVKNGEIGWVCDSGNMWALQRDRSSVGKSNEQFGFFQMPRNENDDWHGFPIIPFSKSRYKISKELFEKWIGQNIISVDEVSAIIKQKRI